MTSLRTHILRHRHHAAALVAAALLLRILVPVGFMPVLGDGKYVVGVCNAAGMSTMVIEIPGLEHRSDMAEAAKSCAFADLSLPALSAADPHLIATLILFILALGLIVAVLPPPHSFSHLRPPSRAPPALT